MSNIYKLISKGTEYDISNTVISETEPTGDDRLPVWIQPNYAVMVDRVIYYDENTSINYKWQFNTSNNTFELVNENDTMLNVVFANSKKSSDIETIAQLKESLIIPVIGKQYTIDFYLSSYMADTPIVIPSTAPIGLVYFDENKDYLGNSIDEIGTEYSSASNNEVYYEFATLPSTARYFCVILPPQADKSYMMETYINVKGSSVTREMVYNILQDNGTYYPISGQ